MAQIGVFFKGWFLKLNKDPVLAMTICHFIKLVTQAFKVSISHFSLNCSSYPVTLTPTRFNANPEIQMKASPF